jgi:hypothetical protein
LPSTTTSQLVLSQQPPDEGPRAEYFPQTDHYVSTPLKELWRRAGGEAIFGLPLTDAIVEQVGDDGTPFGQNARVVQYFERARFEYYPDRIHDPNFGKYSHIYKYFYIVDFGKLGQEQAGTTLQSRPRVTRTQPDGVDYQYFPDTGHDLSGPFLTFWKDHYGAKLFGKPISQPVEESQDGGNTRRLVQYFEQAKLEYYPELKGQPGEVQVAKLGEAALKAKGWLTAPPSDLAGGVYTDTAFYQRWRQVDQPVAQGSASRSWLWGPEGFAVALEPYLEAGGGSGWRLVQYFDKSRMEITQPLADSNSKWYVTNGLLVKELISGQLQTGDNRFEAHAPAQIAIAGDPTQVNQNAPTYATLTSVATLAPDQNRSLPKLGQDVIATLNKAGHLGQLDLNDPLASQVVNATYNQTTGHNIPDVFWRYLTGSRGPIILPGSSANSLSEGDVVDWTFSVGLPLTEAYWVSAKVNGVTREVLVQAFERRILTYTPSNPAAYQVEMGNVGRHYYSWRYLTGQS